MLDENTPVLVGAAQLVQHTAEPAQALSPFAMLGAMAQAAAADAGVSKAVLARADTIGVVEIAGWHTGNAPRVLSEQIGAKARREYTTGIGGELPLVMLNRVAGDIADGSARIALIAGCNNLKTMKRARAAGVTLDWRMGGEGEPERVGGRRLGNSDAEKVVGLVSPPSVYPIFENALRAHRGLSLEAHRKRVGALLSRFSEVASKNPHAWFPTPRSADEITLPGPGNRMIAFPYTKYMNAVLDTDQAAGVLLMSVAAARDHGIPEDRWVYWWGGEYAEERAWYASERPDFAACPALRAAAGGALTRAGIGIDDIDLIDFYSCFPVAVEMACEMLGLDEADPRGQTLTGGLPYAGGPGNNYTLHSLATAFMRLRSRAGRAALVTGNGWYLTKHSASVLATQPKPGPLERAGTSDLSHLPGPVAIHAGLAGDATLETYTVLYGRDGGPERGVVIGRLDAGQRFLANTPDDRASLESFVRVENVGRRGVLSQRGGRALFEPA